jgi:uncharacterized protein (TIGR00369 family)
MGRRVTDEPVRGVNGDPAPLRMSGLEASLGYVRGSLPLPPAHHLTGLRPTDASLGRSTFAMPVTPWLLDAAGIIEPGVLAFLADAPLSVSIYTGLAPGQFVATSELSLTFIQPVRRDAAGLATRARVAHATRDVGVSVAEVEDSDGRLLAHATTRCVITAPPGAPPAAAPATPPAGDGEPADPEPGGPPDPYLRPVWGTIHPPELWDRMTGLEFGRAAVEGKIDYGPVAYLFGAAVVAVDEGTASWRMPSSRWLCASGPALYGGAIAWLAQTAQDFAVLTTLPAGTVYATLDLKVHFLRPVMPGTGDLTAIGEVVHRGRSIAVAQVRVVDQQRRTVAISSGSSMIVPDGIRRMRRGEPLIPAIDDDSRGGAARGETVRARRRAATYRGDGRAWRAPSGCPPGAGPRSR